MSLSSAIVSAGIEYECGISNTKLLSVKRFFRRWNLESHITDQNDGSVNVLRPPSFTPSMYPNWRTNAEITFWSDKKIDLAHFLLYMNKAGAITNITTGMHVHFKFESMPKALAVFSSCAVRKRFDEAYLSFAGTQEMARWDLARRLRSHFADGTCDHNIVIRQLTATSHYDGSRYHQINLATFYRTGTIEVRVLPGMPYPQDKIALFWLIKTMTSLYNRHKDKPKILDNYAKLVAEISLTYPGHLNGWVSFPRTSPLDADERTRVENILAARQAPIRR